MARAKTPAWLLAASVITLVITLVFMMALVVMATVLERQVPENSRFLVVIILALGAGFGAAGLGGEITARGHLPIPGNSGQVMAVSAAGGIALFVVVLLMRDLIVPPNVSGPTLKLNRITAEETARDRALFTAMFDDVPVGPGQRLLVELCSDPDCATRIRAERVDAPSSGSMMIFHAGNIATVKGARLVLENAMTGESRPGKAVPVSW